MDLFVYSRRAIESVTPHEVPHVIISITSSSDDLARFPEGDQCQGILRLSFVDAEAPSDRYAESELFSDQHALRIWQFVLMHRADIERVVVHCDAGVSRSPAVAAAIAKVLTGDDAEFFGGRYRPNLRVYRTLLESNSTLGATSPIEPAQVVTAMATTYLKVNWNHAQPDEPTVLYSELDEERMQLRKIDVFPDGRWGFAEAHEEAGGTQLGSVAMPTVEALNADPEYVACEIDRDEFERLWAARRGARIMSPFPLNDGGGGGPS